MSLEAMLTKKEEDNFRKRHNIKQKIKAGVMTAAASLGMIAGILTYKPSKAIAFGEELPKVEASNPSWYLLQNQPLEAIIKDIQKTDIRLNIGKTSATIDSMNYTLDAAPYIKNSRTMVPVRFITEGLGANVGWDGTERKVTIDYEGKTIELWIGKTDAKVDGFAYILDAAPEIKNSRTFVPIRFIAENFGSTVGWNAAIKEVSIYKEKVSESIDLNSDADGDGLSFSKENELGTNPNSKNTVYNSIDDKKLSELVSAYPGLNIFAKYPDSKTKLTLPDKVKYGLNPLNAFNLDDVLNDEFSIRYAVIKGKAEDKDSIISAVQAILQDYGQKLGSAAKQETAEAIITPEEIDSQAATCQAQINQMWNDRAYKTKADGSAITLEDLTSVERFKALIALNKTFSPEEINILLSQSPTIQKGDLQQYSELIKTLQDASNKIESSLNKKVKETNTFRKYVNQLGLYDYNPGELAAQIWKNADNALREEINSHPKTFLAHIYAFSPWANIGKIVVDGKEFDFQNAEVNKQYTQYFEKFFRYYVDLEKEFKSKNYIFDNELQGFEDYDVTLLQELIPIAPDILKGLNNTFEKVMIKDGIDEALRQTFDLTGEMEIIKERIEQSYHEVQVQGHTFDWLNPAVAPAQISFKISAWGRDQNDSDYGEPYGKITKLLPKDKYYSNTKTPLELATLAYNALEPVNGKDSLTELNQPSIVSMKKIVFSSLGLPLHADMYTASDIRLLISFFHLRKNEIEALKEAKKISQNMAVPEGLMPLQWGQLLFMDPSYNWDSMKYPLSVQTTLLTPAIMNPNKPWDDKMMKTITYTIDFPVSSVSLEDLEAKSALETAIEHDASLSYMHNLKCQLEEKIINVIKTTAY